MVQRTPHAIPLLLSKGVTTVFSSCTLSQLLKVGFGVAEWREETDWRKNSWCESLQNPGCEHTCYPNHSVYPFYWIKLTCSKDLNLKGLKLTNIIIAGGPVKDSFLNSWENHVWESKTQREHYHLIPQDGVPFVFKGLSPSQTKLQLMQKAYTSENKLV